MLSIKTTITLSLVALLAWACATPEPCLISPKTEIEIGPRELIVDDVGHQGLKPARSSSVAVTCRRVP